MVMQLEGEDRVPDKWNPSKKNSDKCHSTTAPKSGQKQNRKIWMHYLKRFPYMFEMQEGAKRKKCGMGQKKANEKKEIRYPRSS